MVDRATGSDVFVGRQAELARMASTLTRVREGQAWLVTVAGESGIGKSAFIRHFLTTAVGFTVLLARGDSTETDLDYGIIDQLVRRADPASLVGHPLLTDPLAVRTPFTTGAELLGVIGTLQARDPLVIVLDDAQWADRRSVEALTFVLRRLTIDSVLVVVAFRGDRDRLDDQTRRMLTSMEQRMALSLSGLTVDDVAPLAQALGAGSLAHDARVRLHESTGGHALYLQTILSEGFTHDEAGRLNVPPSLAAAISDQLAVLPAPTRAMVEMLAVADTQVPLAQLGAAAEVSSATEAIEPAVIAGLVNWSPHEPSSPVRLRHGLQRDAIYSAITPVRRRALHLRAVPLVNEDAAWAHRVAALDRADEHLADLLEADAEQNAAAGHLPIAATHLLWAAEISPSRADRERRLLMAASHLMVSDEARGLPLRLAVEATRPSPLRSCVLGTMAFATGDPVEAEIRFIEALDQARADPSSQALAAVIASRLSGTYVLLGDGHRATEFGRWAVDTGALDLAADSVTRTLIAVGSAESDGPAAGLAALDHLAGDPSRIDPIHVDGLSFRGIFRLSGGDVAGAVEDLSASLRKVRHGATFTLGLRAYFALAMAQYLAGSWDDALLTADQAFSAASIHARSYELPSLHLAAGCVLAGRGETDEAERHALLAEAAAAALGYSQERVFAAIMRAFVAQAVGDYAAMAMALNPWLDEKTTDGRSQMYGVLWRPLLAEGLIGSGNLAAAERVLDQLPAADGLRPAVVWLRGWLAEGTGDTDAARTCYQSLDKSTLGDSPLYGGRLQLAHGRLLRRIGARREAVEQLRGAHALFTGLRAQPFIAQAEDELSSTGLTRAPSAKRPILAMTPRESEVAVLVGRGLTNVEVAAELFVTPKAVAYHLGNIYAKFGFTGRQQLRRALNQPSRTGDGLAD